MIQPVKWRQIAADLRHRIDTGELSPGDPVPSEADLAALYDVARMTARQALVALEQAAILSPGRPRTVARHEPLTVHVTRTDERLWSGEEATAGADSWAADMLSAGVEPAQRIEVVTTTATPAIAARLGVAEGQHVVARRLVRLAAGDPHNLITFWFPLGVAASTDLALPESIKEGSVTWLEKTRGPLAHDMEVTTRMPLPAETDTLRIPGGVPVLIVWRVSRDPKRRPVVASMAVYPSDRAALRMEL